MDRTLRSFGLIVACAVAIPLLPGATRVFAQGTDTGHGHGKQWKNYGVLTIQDDINLTTSGSLMNLGTVNVDSGGSLIVHRVYSQTAGATDVSGTLIAPTIRIGRGLLDGSGTLRGSVTIGSGATIEAGDSPATMLIAGNLTLDKATMNEVMGSGTSYSVLDVSGTLDISHATLQLDSLNGLSLTAGEKLDILNFNGWNGGKFSDGSIIFEGDTFDISYLTSGCAVGYKDCIDVTYSPDPAPEPGTILLLGLVLTSLVVALKHWELLEQ